MCGIFGLLLKSQARRSHANFSFRHLYNQLQTIKGRGPENTNLVQVSKSLIMGFQRLRIVDASPAGDQPLRKGNISVIANAEIYNFKALKEKYGFKHETGSDCEIFLHLYEKFGHPENFIHELDGVFAFVLHDADKN